MSTAKDIFHGTRQRRTVPDQAFVLEDIKVLATIPANLNEADPLGLIEDAAIVVERGRFSWVGPREDLPPSFEKLPHYSLGDRVVVPGFVDAHTHVVYGGCRSADFNRRCHGASYEEILEAGGGIHTTVGHTRANTMEELVASATPRLSRMLAHGTTTVEIKSGYGLSLDEELKMLLAIRDLSRRGPQKIIATFLGAHVVPREVDSAQDYVRQINDEMLPAVRAQDLATFVDVFCEHGAFTVAQSQAILERANDLGFSLKLHAEQLTRTGGTALAAKLKATSVDHVDNALDEDLRELAKSGTVAVLLPSATVFLGGTSLPQMNRFRDAKVRVALATDCNPGSSPTEDLSFVAGLGCSLMGMTPEEALRGITTEAARALNLEEDVGSVAPGYRADLVILSDDAMSPTEIPYRFGASRVDEVLVAGEHIIAGAGRL